MTKENILFTNGLPLKESPYPGFNQTEYVLNKGEIIKEGRMPLASDVLVQQDVKVPLSDGTNIYIDIFRPNKSGKFPVVLWYAPYGKRNSLLNMDNFNHPTRMDVKPEWEDGLNAFEAPNPSYWVSNDYIVISPDPRGIGSSEGNAYAWGSQNAKDEYDLINWIENQEWSNGSVGTTGTSFLAMTQYKVASLKPRALKAIAPWEGAFNPFAESMARGGVPDLGFSATLSRMLYTDAQIEDTGAMFMADPFYNDYWADKTPDLSDVEIPAYFVGSWTNALHSKGATEAFTKLKSENKWLRIHNTHEWTDYYNPENVEDLRRFFDHYLKGVDNGWESTPKVRMTVLNPGHEDIVNRPEESYPPKGQTIQTLYLNKENDDLTLTNSPKLSEDSISYDVTSEGITFKMTMPESSEYIGQFSAKLFVEAVENDDMDLFIFIRKIGLDGEKLEPEIVTDRFYPGPNGRLRVSQRKLNTAESTPLNPVLLQTGEEKLNQNEIVEVEVPFWPFGMKWEKGEVLEMTISPNDQIIRPEFPDLPPVPTINKGQHKIYFGGQYDSQVRLPLIKN